MKSRYSNPGGRRKPFAFGLLAALAAAILILGLSSGCQSLSGRPGGLLAAFQQADEPEAPRSLDEWMRLKRLDP